MTCPQATTGSSSGFRQLTTDKDVLVSAHISSACPDWLRSPVTSASKPASSARKYGYQSGVPSLTSDVSNSRRATTSRSGSRTVGSNPGEGNPSSSSSLNSPSGGRLSLPHPALDVDCVLHSLLGELRVEDDDLGIAHPSAFDQRMDRRGGDSGAVKARLTAQHRRGDKGVVAGLHEVRPPKVLRVDACDGSEQVEAGGQLGEIAEHRFACESVVGLPWQQ